MKSELSSIEVGIIVNELRGLIGAKIDRIYDLDAKDVVLLFHKPRVGKIKVRIMAPKAGFIAFQDFEFPDRPSGFCLQLRKYLEGSRLEAVRQMESERIIEFSFYKGVLFKLVVELFSKGNVILCDGEDVILGVSERQFWSDRQVISGAKYKHPSKNVNFYHMLADDLWSVFQSSDRDSVVKSLAMDVGLGGVYSEELCLLSSVDKAKMPKDVSASEAESLVGSLKSLILMPLKPGIVYDGENAVNVVPFMLRVYEGMGFRQFDSFSSALDYYYSKEFKVKSAYDKRIDEVKRIISEQEAMIVQIESDIGENTAKADAIYHHYSVVKDVIDALNVARGKMDWKEIKKKLQGHGVVKDIDERQGKVTIEV